MYMYVHVCACVHVHAHDTRMHMRMHTRMHMVLQPAYLVLQPGCSGLQPLEHFAEHSIETNCKCSSLVSIPMRMLPAACAAHVPR